MNRGIRNNNPGNIERNNTRWQGMSENQTDPRFVSFDHPKWGIRAICRILITYQDKRRASDGSDIDSVLEIIERWAPPHENNTDAYSAFVARKLGRAVDDETVDVYDYATMRSLVLAIIYFENGSQPYDEATVNAGLRLAGIDVPSKDLSKSRTVKASSIAGFSASAIVAVEQIDAIKALIEPLVPQMEIAQYLLLGLTLASVALTIWARIDDATNESRS